MKKAFGIGLGAVVGLAAVLLAARLLTDGTSGPQVIDRGEVIGKLTKHSDFLAATKTYRSTFDVKDECHLPVIHTTLPGSLCGTDATFDVDGSVAATVDFSGLQGDRVLVDHDGNVKVTLPPVQVGRPSISEVDPLGQDRGLLDRLSSVFSSGDGKTVDLVTQHGNERLVDAGRGDHDLTTAAEAHTRDFVKKALVAAGAKSVQVDFEHPGDHA